jgi:signal transduction histidine kinase
MATAENGNPLSSAIYGKDEIINNLIFEKNSLLKIISHDIRGPFNQIFALLQLMELDSGKISDEQKVYIDKIYLAVIGGMEMVKNLHDSRAMDQGNITLKTEKFSVKQLIRQSIRNFSILSRIKNIRQEFDDTVPDQEIIADRILLLKALDNVLSNSIKFSEIKTIIMITLKRENDKTAITIRDQGPGLPEEEIPMIYKKFQKLSAKPTLGEGSTGLGMYLSGEFMKMMNGQIKIENCPNGGLEVTLII